MKNQKCKGMQDLLPEAMLRFRRIEDVFRTCCRNWGYQEVRTPTLEYLYLFTATGTLTPSMLSKVYSFLDWDGWSGERVVLRPDGTIPVARLYIDNLSGQELARLFYVTNIFAFEGTGKENRERWQCGAEFFGGAKLAPDVEIILLAKEVIRRLGISNVGLQLSHAGLVKALLKEFKLSPGEEAKMTNRILEGNWQALTKAKSTNPEIDRLMAALLGLKGKSSSFLHNVRASFPKASRDFKSSLEDLLSITTLLDNLGCSYEIDIAAIHGFEYYTGICFQFLAAGEKIGGGGRYDNLVPLMNGKDIPACGFALYVDHIMKLLPLGKEKKGKSGILIKGKELAPEIIKTCFTVAESLRDAGYVVELYPGGQGLTDLRWTLDVQKKIPLFILSDRVKNRRFEVQTASEVLALLASKEL
ncbi:ATP phosphoribosyltransferase regulatory subunit [Candidatus Bathyarchaeota archaeon]|nr:ATP phosphoribosyltransferase regulatory subunit [Candidatus Bathyarchaeota archaeon]